MAYADARNPQRTIGTVAVVATLEAGLAVALVLGLSYSYSTRPPDDFTAIEVAPEPKIVPPAEPPKPAPDNPRVIERPKDAREPVILGPAPQPSFAADDDGAGEGIGGVAFPTPIPSPAPNFAPVRAKPRGNPASWVTENDYPTSEIRAERQGRTGFRLRLDAAGKVSDCTITASSGSPVLDATTCEKLTRRARFEPAIDSTGTKTEGYYVGAVNWRLPED